MKNRRKTRIVPVPVIREQIQKEEVNLRKEYIGRIEADNRRSSYYDGYTA